MEESYLKGAAHQRMSLKVKDWQLFLKIFTKRNKEEVWKPINDKTLSSITAITFYG